MSLELAVARYFGACHPRWSTATSTSYSLHCWKFYYTKIFYQRSKTNIFINYYLSL